VARLEARQDVIGWWVFVLAKDWIWLVGGLKFMKKTGLGWLVGSRFDKTGTYKVTK
jgi:hypothetical protein